jgi:hypothetical protein
MTLSELATAGVTTCVVTHPDNREMARRAGEPEAASPDRLDGVAIIRDERGVRLARELQSED